MRAILCVSLPFWPTNLIERKLGINSHKSQKPLILIKETRGAKLIHALNRPALKLGLGIGQSLVHARAICPEILVHDANEKSDAEALKKLALWAISFSPHISTRIFGAHYALVFDITGCAHLFGGEAKMMAQILARLKSFGIDASAKIAPTLGSAWALAFYDRKDCGDIDALPIEALRLDAKTNESLIGLGLKTIGQLAKVPAKPLARRFGDGVSRALGYARGGIHEPINPIHEITELFINHRLENALLTMSGIESALEIVVKKLCELLKRQNKGARIIRICFYRLDGVVFEIRAKAANANHYCDIWLRLLKQRLEQKSDIFDFGFGIDVINAYGELAQELKAEAIDLDPLAAAAIKSADAVHRLAERLSARIGETQVCRIYTQENWVPERAQSHSPAIGFEDKGNCVPEFLAKRRPILLFKRPRQIDAIAEVPDGPPKQFRFRGLNFKVKHATPAERIIEPLLSNGLNGGTMPINNFLARDYYQIQSENSANENGSKFFIYRIGNYGEALPPKWFIQGTG